MHDPCLILFVLLHVYPVCCYFYCLRQEQIGQPWINIVGIEVTVVKIFLILLSFFFFTSCYSSHLCKFRFPFSLMDKHRVRSTKYLQKETTEI